MTKKYELSPASRQDLIDIEDSTFEQFGLKQALQINDEFTAAFEKLAENPGLGHLREDLSPSGEHFHYWPVKKTFLIVYRADSRPLQIVRVLHGKRHVRATGMINFQMSASEPRRDKEVEAADVGHRRWKLTQAPLGAASSGGN